MKDWGKKDKISSYKRKKNKFWNVYYVKAYYLADVAVIYLLTAIRAVYLTVNLSNWKLTQWLIFT